MDVYICLLFDEDDMVIGSSMIPTVNNGSDVRAKAHALLRDSAMAKGFELWLNGEKQYSHFPDRTRKPAG
jgi:hypothetical protein